MTDIIERLRIKSNMINMGESIQFGSETALMDEAAETIETLRAANKDSQAEVEKLKGALERLSSPLAFTNAGCASPESTARMFYAEAALKGASDD